MEREIVTDDTELLHEVLTDEHESQLTDRVEELPGSVDMILEFIRESPI